jgi:hypothetical protein
MWVYAALGGVNLVLDHGLDFTSPFGALTDAVLFPLIFVFAVSLAFLAWRHRAAFN